MLKHSYTKSFKKQYKLLQKRGKDMGKLIEIMNMIINEVPLPPNCRNHPLHGDLKGSYDCHIEGDWVLIYEPDKKAGKVSFKRTGTHSDLDI